MYSFHSTRLRTVGRRFLPTLAALFVCAMSSTAFSYDSYEGFGETGLSLMHGRWVSVTGLYGGGAGQLGASDAGFNPVITGMRYYERKGSVTGILFAGGATVGGSVARSQPKSVERYREGQWEITETTEYSAAEKAQMQAETEATSEAMMNIDDQSFELELYSTSMPGGGEVSGYKANMSFGVSLWESVVLDVGIGFGSADARMIRDGREALVHLAYFGMPLRLNVAAGPAIIYAAWDWNWLSEWSNHKPELIDEASRYRVQSTLNYWELGLQTAIFKRLLVQAGVTTPVIDSFEFGYRATVGLRF